MKLSSLPFTPIKLGGVLVLVVAGAWQYNAWRHPPLPATFPLPPTAYVSYSWRYFNPFMTGPALYYRIEAPQSQHSTAKYINQGEEFLRPMTGAELAQRPAFSELVVQTSPNDTALTFSLYEQDFPVESYYRSECRVWRTTSGSTAEIFVWTKM